MASQVISGRVRHFAPVSAFSESIRFPQSFVTPSASALFAGLSQPELSQIVSCARVRTFACDELLYSQGQIARSLVVLQSGSVKHTQLSANGDEVLLRMSGAGEAVNLQTPPNTSAH